MWNIEKVQISNIMSIADQVWQVNNNALSLIYGINSTDPDAHSNGSGKSTLLECIKLGLTTKTIKNVNKKDIVRHGQSDGYIKMVLKNTVINEEMLIEKYFASKSSNKCKIFINGNLQEHLVDMNITESDKFILEKLKLSSSEIDDYFLISKEKYTSFFNASDKVKKELINRFSKIDVLDPVDDMIKTDIDKIKSDIAHKRHEIDNNNASIIAFKASMESIDEQKQKWQNDAEELLKKSQGTLTDIEVKMGMSSTMIVINPEEVKAKGDYAEQIAQKTLLDQKQQIHNYHVNIDKLNEQARKSNEALLEATTMVNKMQGSLVSQATCPKCQYTFSINDASTPIETVEKNIGEAEAFCNEIRGVLEEIRNKIRVNEDKISEIKTNFDTTELDLAKKEHQDLRMRQQEGQNALQIIESEITSLKSIHASQTTQIESLQKMIADADKGKISDQIKYCEAKNESIEKEVQELESSIVKLYASSQSLITSFKTTIANNSLSYIQQEANDVLTAMQCPHRVSISGYKMLASGKLKDKITVSIARNGVGEEPFGSFSGGEKAKVDFACMSALNKIINKNVAPYGLNLMCIDEVLESIDSEGFVSLVDSIKNIDSTILLITHVDPETIHNVNKIVVEKVNGITQIV